MRKPTRADVTVDSWEERDRFGIFVTDDRDGSTVAEWWDDDARQMFEDGFFEPGSWLADSVLRYCEDVGILRSLPATKYASGKVVKARDEYKPSLHSSR